MKTNSDDTIQLSKVNIDFYSFFFNCTLIVCIVHTNLRHSQNVNFEVIQKCVRKQLSRDIFSTFNMSMITFFEMLFKQIICKTSAFKRKCFGSTQ